MVENLAERLMVGLKMMGDKENMRCPECGLILYQAVSECPRCFAPIDTAAPKPPMVERVYEEEVIEKKPKERKDIKRIAAIILIIVVVACLIISLAYHFVIPRVELNVITVYRESSGLSINLDSKVKNEGTLGIQHFNMNITIFDSNLQLVANGSHYLPDLDAHTSHNFNNIQFFGDQYDNYHIIIVIVFESEGKEYSEIFEHTAKEYMYMRFEDKYMSWGG